MHRPADLLIVQDAAGEAVDAVVQADAKLAQGAGAGIKVEHGEEVILPFVGTSRDDPAGLEFEGNADDLAAVAADREPAAEPAPGRVLDRAGEDLAGGHVPAPVGVDPGPPG